MCPCIFTRETKKMGTVESGTWGHIEGESDRSTEHDKAPIDKWLAAALFALGLVRQ
jgi:hypothetical protein